MNLIFKLNIMKTKFLKIGMPLMVFMLAVVFAFASQSKANLDENLSTEFIFNAICQPVDAGCNNLEREPCMYEGKQVYGQNFTAYCDVALSHRE